MKTNWLDRTVSWFSPQAGLRRMRARAVASTIQLSYEGAKTGRRTDGWLSSGTSANAEIIPQVTRLRERSRDLIRNNPHAAKALNVLVSNIIGAGITAQPNTGNDSLNQKITEIWNLWVSECDADEQLDFYGIQDLITRTMFESGECLVRFRARRPQDGMESIPVQIQALEPDYLDISKNGATATGYIYSGIEFDKLGTRVAYWLFNQHPGESLFAPARGLSSKRIPAEDVLHIYEKTRPGQIRGVPRLAPVILKLRDLDDFDEAELVRKKIEACFAAFVTQNEGADGPTLGNSTESDGKRIESFEPGMVEYLKPGEDVKFGTPNAATGYSDYVRTQLRIVAAGIGVTYEQISGDLSSVNYSSYRAGHLEFRRMVDALRWRLIIPSLCIPVYRRFIKLATSSGLISSENYSHKWTPPRFESIDPYKDANADKLMIRSGTLPLKDAIAAQGLDPDLTLQEIARTNELLDKLGIVLDTDPRKTNPNNGGANNAQTQDQSAA